MSLNGLDATEITEAYQAALGEGGGWFLLKYNTRDEVGLLKRGSGGVVDIRESIALNDEQSPLYGFVHYRRRKVILKYIPEGTSRLLQGLNDVALSSACSLHTASASIKSSSDSLRQRGLSEIVEDAGESQQPEAVIPLPNLEKVDTNDTLDTQIPLERTEHKDITSASQTSRNMDKALPPTPLDRTEVKATTRNALEDTLLDIRPSFEERTSIQSTRPSIKYHRAPYDYQPKVKLGPRPSMESQGRKHSIDRVDDVRPVSTLPTGVRLPVRKAPSGRPKSASGRTPVLELSEFPLPSPVTSSKPVIKEENLSPVLTAIPKQFKPTESKPSAMTPEKRRLRKALELRQKQLAARNSQQNSERERSSHNYVPPMSDHNAQRDSLTSSLPDVTTADDGSTDVLQERIDALRQDPDIVHVGPQTLGKDAPDAFEISPVSILRPSESPSTQASSISDQDETPTQTESLNEHKAPVESSTKTSLHDQQSPRANHDRGPLDPQPRDQGASDDRSDMNATESERPTAALIDSRPSDGLPEAVYDQGTFPQGKGNPGEGAVKAPTSTIYSGQPSIRRSSSAKSNKRGTDALNPHEIPLPLIDEDEVINLSPQRRAFERLTSVPQREAEELQRPEPGPPFQESEALRETRPSSEDTLGEQRERRIRRHGLISPIKRVSSPDYSDDQFLSDDSFMEELTSATVQEAKPISVSKSPIMPVFPRSVSDSKSSEELRPASASNRLNRQKRQIDQPMMPKLPDLFSARSASASYAPLLEAQLSPPTLKKLGVSSGISQRIKALEQLSSRPSSPSQIPSPSTMSGPSPTFTSARKTSFRASQAAAEIARSSTQNNKTRPQMPSSPPAKSPENIPMNHSDNIFRIDVATKHGKTRPESISVTARIIRGPQNKASELLNDPSKPQAIDLYPSPLTVEHQSMRPTSPPSPLKPPKPRYARSISSTSSAQKSEPLPAIRRDSISSRLSSTPSRRGSELDLPHSMSDSSINTLANFDGSKEDKKESRKSRLFKRMSNISAASRRSIASALSPVRKDIKEEPIVEHQEPSRETIRPLAVEIGDVNVQFPDTLLWKRRHMKIDEGGLLVLSASKTDNNSKVISKRYPLTEFNPPYLPDQDQQELPNSVVLDFRDGSTLQCACENSYSQTEVFRALKQAHYRHNSHP
ncbi:MAG: hypothetical protein Q9220_003527 [cf. Caloplaca sp. 1 TL-2023]